MQFEWDRYKAKENFARHRIPFREARTAFGDPLSITIADDEHGAESGFDMKRVKTTLREPQMRPYYEFDGGVRGKYAKRYGVETNVVLLDPDVAKVFRGSESVNETLRLLMRIAERGRSRRRPRTRPKK